MTIKNYKGKLFFIIVGYDKNTLSYSVQDANTDFTFERGFNIPRSEVKQPKRLLNKLREQYDNSYNPN